MVPLVGHRSGGRAAPERRGHPPLQSPMGYQNTDYHYGIARPLAIPNTLPVLGGSHHHLTTLHATQPSESSHFWNGCLDVVRELLALTGDRRVDVHAQEEHAFHGACEKGHLGVVRELLAPTGDRTVSVHAQKKDAFCLACQEGQLDVVRKLLGLTGNRAVPAGTRAQYTTPSLHAEAGPS